LYVAFPSSAGEPPQQLKGFQKVFLNPGQTTTVTFNLTQQDLSIWDVGTHSWALQSGTFGVLVGASSRDIRLKGSFTV
jgi:beta-glucosidase